MTTARCRARWIQAPALLGLLICVSSLTAAQTLGDREDFTAVAIQNDEIGAGAGVILMQITRWSTEAEREQFVTTLRQKGPRGLLDLFGGSRSVGTIRTPDSLGYDLRYSQQMETPEGGRQILLATDRPLSFWESWNQPRSVDYPFTVVQMEIDRQGTGKGTMSYAARLRATRLTIEIENFSISPVMLTQIQARKR